MKNIFINKNQFDLIKEAIEDARFNLPEWLINKITEKKTPLSSDKNYINDSIKKLADKSYKDTINAFSDDITKFDIDEVENKLNKLILICQKKEENIKAELEKLCSDVVMSLFKLNGRDIEFECNLIDVKFCDII